MRYACSHYRCSGLLLSQLTLIDTYTLDRTPLD